MRGWKSENPGIFRIEREEKNGEVRRKGKDERTADAWTTKSKNINYYENSQQKEIEKTGE